jgi:hypothetical protein
MRVVKERVCGLVSFEVHDPHTLALFDDVGEMVAGFYDGAK